MIITLNVWLTLRHSAIVPLPAQTTICYDTDCTGCSVRRTWSNCFSTSIELIAELIVDTLRNKCRCKESVVCLVGRSFTFDTDQSRLLLRQTGVEVWGIKNHGQCYECLPARRDMESARQSRLRTQSCTGATERDPTATLSFELVLHLMCQTACSSQSVCLRIAFELSLRCHSSVGCYDWQQQSLHGHLGKSNSASGGCKSVRRTTAARPSVAGRALAAKAT